MIPMIPGVGVQYVIVRGLCYVQSSYVLAKTFLYNEVITPSWVSSLCLLITMLIFPDARERDLEEACVFDVPVANLAHILSACHAAVHLDHRLDCQSAEMNVCS
jgi:hypothetical protein